jgi:hypothetical protein
MRQNAQAAGERERERENVDAERREALRVLVENIEKETTHVAERSAENGSALASHAQELTASTARVLASASSVTDASTVALERSVVVAAAGEELSVSALEIVGRINGSAAEIASTARAGERAQHIIGQLSDAVGDIGAVARLISDIASRTNLLALNATIEAARAGDAGRGFAVVATEVKALASQTAHSTEEISRNANAIQQATQDAVKVVGEMVGRLASIERITHSVAAAAEQQTSATGEIARNVAESAEAMRLVSAQIRSMTVEAHATDTAVTGMRELTRDVSAQIAELGSVMVRIVRTSSVEVNRRDDARVEVNMAATISLNGRDVPGTCINLSRGGARLRVAQTLAEGCDIILRLPGLPDLPGRVVKVGEETGISFAWDPSAAPAALTGWLEQRAAA